VRCHRSEPNIRRLMPKRLLTYAEISGTPGEHNCSLKAGDNLNTGRDSNCVSRFFTDFFTAVTRPVFYLVHYLTHLLNFMETFKEHSLSTRVSFLYFYYLVITDENLVKMTPFGFSLFLYLQQLFWILFIPLLLSSLLLSFL